MSLYYAFFFLFRVTSHICLIEFCVLNGSIVRADFFQFSTQTFANWTKFFNNQVFKGLQGWGGGEFHLRSKECDNYQENTIFFTAKMTAAFFHVELKKIKKKQRNFNFQMILKTFCLYCRQNYIVHIFRNRMVSFYSTNTQKTGQQKQEILGGRIIRSLNKYPPGRNFRNIWSFLSNYKILRALTFIQEFRKNPQLRHHCTH